MSVPGAFIIDQRSALRAIMSSARVTGRDSITYKSWP